MAQATTTEKFTVTPASSQFVVSIEVEGNNVTTNVKGGRSYTTALTTSKIELLKKVAEEGGSIGTFFNEHIRPAIQSNK